MIHATTLTVIPGTVLAKLVLCIFYYRLSPIDWYRHAIFVTASITVAAFTAVWFAVQFACRPIEAAWNLRLSPTATCIDRPPVYMPQAVMGGVTDIMLMALPLPIILRLQMSPKHKLAVVAWFGTGLLTLGAALARLVILIPSLQNPDTTYVLAQGTLWLMVEANLIIICGSLPTFRIFLSHVWPGLLGETRSSISADSESRRGGLRRPLRPVGMRYASRTFGSSGAKRKEFDTIDELELPIHGGGSRVRSVVNGGPGVADSDTQRKANVSGATEEEFIVKTVRTSVAYDSHQYSYNS